MLGTNASLSNFRFQRKHYQLQKSRSLLKAGCSPAVTSDTVGGLTGRPGGTKGRRAEDGGTGASYRSDKGGVCVYVDKFQQRPYIRRCYTPIHYICDVYLGTP